MIAGVAKLWQNYRVRSGLIGSSPTSDSSVEIENETMKEDQDL